jgi:hypothetical protein
VRKSKVATVATVGGNAPQKCSMDGRVMKKKKKKKKKKRRI